MWQRFEKYSPAITAGLIAAIIVIAVSLPLRSPHDALLNAATIAIASGVTTLILAVIWAALQNEPHRTRESLVVKFVAICAIGFGVTAIGAFAVQEFAELERTVAFIVPLAAIQFAVTAGLTLIARTVKSASRFAVFPLLVAVVSIGIVFADNGDQPSGRLELPKRTTSVETIDGSDSLRGLRVS